MVSKKEKIDKSVDEDIKDPFGNVIENFYIVHLLNRPKQEEIDRFKKKFKCAVIFIQSITNEPIMVKIEKEVYIMLMKALK